MGDWKRHWPTYLGSAKLNSLDPKLYLTGPERIADHPLQPQRTPALEYQPTETDPTLI